MHHKNVEIVTRFEKFDLFLSGKAHASTTRVEKVNRLWKTHTLRRIDRREQPLKKKTETKKSSRNKCNKKKRQN